MATVGTNYLTLADHARMLAPNGDVDIVVDILSKTNDIVDSMLWKEGNLPTGEKTTVVTGYPTTGWRKLNEGYQASKLTTEQVTDTCGMLGTFGEVDIKVAGLNGNTNAFRFEQDRFKLRALSNNFATALIYGNQATDPEQITGFAPRYNAIGDNVLSGGGSGSDNTSIWLINWGGEGAYGIFPKGSKAGVQTTDLGKQVIEDSNGGKYLGYQNYYEWECGLTVKDGRNVVRIGNIDVSELKADASAGANIIELMIKAVHIPQKNISGKTEFYVNKTIFTYLDLQTYNSSNMNIGYGKDEHGKEVLKFRGIPVKQVDAIVDTEASLS